jgi:VanZ family protein
MHIPRSSKFNIYHILLFFYVIGIFGLSSIPPSEIPKIDFGFPIDKVVHFVEYGIFGFLLSKVFLKSKKLPIIWSALLVILISIALGAIDESYQHFTKRTPSIYDWFADISGATVFMIFTLLFSKSSRHGKKK